MECIRSHKELPDDIQRARRGFCSLLPRRWKEKAHLEGACRPGNRSLSRRVAAYPGLPQLWEAV